MLHTHGCRPPIIAIQSPQHRPSRRRLPITQGHGNQPWCEKRRPLSCRPLREISTNIGLIPGRRLRPLCYLVDAIVRPTMPMRSLRSNCKASLTKKHARSSGHHIWNRIWRAIWNADSMQRCSNRLQPNAERPCVESSSELTHCPIRIRSIQASVRPWMTCRTSFPGTTSKFLRRKQCSALQTPHTFCNRCIFCAEQSQKTDCVRLFEIARRGHAGVAKLDL